LDLKERFSVTRFRDRPFALLGLTVAFAAALTLAACGRKGPLDPPPSASAAGDAQAQAQTEAAQAGPAANPFSPTVTAPKEKTVDNKDPGIDKFGRAVAPRGENKRVPLDALLN
jgi:predicted small lipoprotein YifL